MRERGKLIESSNPQPEIRKNAETASDWEFRDEAARLYDLAVIIRDRLIDPVLRLDRNKVPDPVISFDNLRQSRTLAAYTLNRNPQGLLHEITFNTEHYEVVDGKVEWKYGRWAQAETLVHEYLHLKQQKYGRDPYRGGRNGHNKEFAIMAKQLGLNVVTVIGCHYKVADEGSPFAILMAELGIPRPNDVPRGEGVKVKDDWFEIGKKRKGRSSLTKYTCGCQNAWIGASEFAARCTRCGNDFVMATALREIVNEMANTTPDEEPNRPPVQPVQPSGPAIDFDTEMHRRQEEQEFKDTDEWEDLGRYMDQYSNDF